MRITPRPLNLVNPEAVAADVVAQVHGILDEKRVEPAVQLEQKQEGARFTSCDVVAVRKLDAPRVGTCK